MTDDLVEAGVLVGVRLARGHPRLLRDKELVQLLQLFGRDPCRRKRRDGGLDDAAELDDIGERVTPRDERLKRPREIVGRDLLHEGAAAGARLDDAEELQRAQRLAHRCARHLELVRQGTLRRELLAGLELALLEKGFDLLDDALVQAAAADPGSPVRGRGTSATRASSTGRRRRGSRGRCRR